MIWLECVVELYELQGSSMFSLPCSRTGELFCDIYRPASQFENSSTYFSTLKCYSLQYPVHDWLCEKVLRRRIRGLRIWARFRYT